MEGNPFDEEYVQENKDCLFYEFRTDKPCLTFQQDGHNCALGTALTIMRVGRALQYNNTSHNWLDVESKQKSFILTSIFYSLQFGLQNPNLLQSTRYEVLDLFDKLAFKQSKKYKYPKL